MHKKSCPPSLLRNFYIKTDKTFWTTINSIKSSFDKETDIKSFKDVLNNHKSKTWNINCVFKKYSDHLYIVIYMYKMGHYFLDI